MWGSRIVLRKISGYLFSVTALVALSANVSADVIGNISGDISVSQGSLSYTLPLSTPDSIHGLNPDLSLGYQQQSGSGILGAGFSLGATSSISRCTPNIQKDGFSAGIELNSNARFCHGGSKLVAVSGENGASNTEYRSFIDNNNKYVSYGGSNNTPTSWKQYSPDGYIRTFERKDGSPDLFASWLLTKTENQFGSSITYSYSNDTIPVLDRIDYPGYSVDLIYETRQNPLKQYQQGVSAELNKRLQKIKVFSGAEQVYEYQFTYETIGNLFQTERLLSVTRCHGSNGSAGCLIPVEFGYAQQPDSSQALDTAADKTIAIPKSYYAGSSALKDVGFTYRPSFTTGDLNRDGFPDFCYYEPNTGMACTLYDSAGYGTVSTWSEDLGYDDDIDDYKFYANVALLDLNNDGYSDYCLSDDTGVRCGLNNGSGGFSSASYWSVSSGGGVNHEQFPQFQNIDGDNLPDVCGLTESGGQGSYRCYSNTGSAFSGELVNLSNQVDIFYSLSVTPGILDSIDATADKAEGNLPAPAWHDIDGDLDLDLCWIDRYGQYQCSIRSTDTSTGDAVYATPASQATINIPLVPTDPAHVDYHDDVDDYHEGIADFKLSLRHADLNGDGLIDICYENNDQYQCRINTGTGFDTASDWLDISYITGLVDRREAGLASISVGDMDLDGLADFCAIYDDYQHCAYNQSGSFGALTPRQVIHPDIDIDLTVTRDYVNGVRRLLNSKTTFVQGAVGMAYGKFLSTGDVNADGYPDTCYRSIDGVVCVTSDNFAPQALLTRVTDSFGQKTDVTYANLLGSGLYQAASSVPAGFFEAPQNRRVVASLTSDSGASMLGNASNNPGEVVRNQIDYQYHGYVVDPVDEISGFSAIEWTNTGRNTRTKSSYYLEEYLQGQEKTIEEFIDNQLVKQKTNQFRIESIGSGSRVRQILDGSTETQNDLNGNLVSTAQITHNNIDSYGFPQTVTSVKTQGSETVTTVTNTTYLHDTASWLLSRPDYQTVTHTDQAGVSIVREVDYQYQNGQLKTEIIQPSSSKAQTIEYVYDGQGNAISVSTSGSGVTRTLTKTFDSLGRILTQTDALGQSESFTYHSRCGGVETHTDIAGRVTTTSYDDICRDFKVEAHDDNSTTREYLWAETADNDWINQAPDYPFDYNNPVVFKIKETTAAGPWSISYYDAQGRVVKSESLGYSDSQNARVARTLTGYDRYGRKTATTLPFYETNGYAVTPSWIQLSYDLAGRPVTEEKTGPDGLPSTTTYTYQGETTTLSYADYSKTTVNGIHGKPKSITENGLTIDYSYDPLGNLLTTSTGGLVTTLEYDERGNKIKQDDPSMGLWEYDYNAFGELIWQKDAKAQETTFEYDELGRQKNRTDVDGVTTWSYYTSGDGIGQLQQETGTHATKSWAYNADGLVASEILTVNGKTFATGFEYDAYSRLITKNEDNGQTLHYDYDNTGAIQSVSVPKEDFNDFNFDVLKNEYDVILTQIVDIEAQIVGLELQAQNHYKQAIAYAAQVSYFQGLLDEVNVQLGEIADASEAHMEMADRYMEEARVYRELADELYAQFGDKEFIYKGEENGEFEFQHKRCTKKKSSLLGKKCKRYEYYTIKINSGELNLVDVNAGMIDRSIKHNTGYEVSTSWITPKSEEVRTITYRAAKPWQIYSDTADAWQALADIELEAANADAATIEATTTQVYMPVEVFKDVWVPIAGEITFFVFVEDAKFIENQWVEMSLTGARDYYQERIDHYQLLAEQALDDYQALIDDDGSIEGIASLREDLSELLQSQALFEENLLALGLDPDDLDSAAQDQADATAANNRLNVWMATMRTASGALERELFGNGLRTVRDINDDNGLVDRITTSAFSGTVLRDVEYDYNSRGQIISKHDVTTERYQTTETFGYNGQNQLTSWNYDQTVNIQSETTVESLARTYSYDNRGNMTFKTGAGTMGYNSANNRLDTRTLDGTSYNYHYDANGNMTSGDNRSYTWNAFNKVEQVVANGHTVDFQYDASRSRVFKDTADETIYYVNKGYEMIVRKDSAGLPTETIHRHQVWNGHDVVATYEKTRYRRNRCGRTGTRK